LLLARQFIVVCHIIEECGMNKGEVKHTSEILLPLVEVGSVWKE
jgi:hypothetical protein